SMRCVGYRQSWAMLDEAALRSRRGANTSPVSDPLAPSDIAPSVSALLAERGVAATRQLAKRQLTWLRSMPQRIVVACDRPDALDVTIVQALRLLQGDHVTARD
ncbi:MAG: tRNA ((37)-N6)-dimethylallyltransferase MiaA, partial [Rhizobacter sp.]|nr:tRNA ((37)-N6)-dimethylallyltransferase MiaA [Rhizobacter sp.]